MSYEQSPGQAGLTLGNAMRSKRQITTVGVHVGGEASQIIVGGVLPPNGKTMFERMQNMERDQDHIRRFLMLEPRGGINLSVNLITPPVREECAAGVIIMESTEYVPMSGSNTIATVTTLLETGMIPMTEPETRFVLDTPAGPVNIVAQCRDGACVGVELTNVPCMPIALDVPLEIDGLGRINVDISYGGMIYAIADSSQLGFSLEPSEAKDISIVGEKIRIAAREQFPCRHPENSDIENVTIVQIVEPCPASALMGPNRLN